MGKGNCECCDYFSFLFVYLQVMNTVGFNRQDIVVTTNLKVDDQGNDDKLERFRGQSFWLFIVLYVGVFVCNISLFHKRVPLILRVPKKYLCLLSLESTISFQWRDQVFFCQTHESISVQSMFACENLKIVSFLKLMIPLLIMFKGVVK